MRPPSDSPKTTMNSIDDSTGATIVCVQSFSTRALSRPDSAISPWWRRISALIRQTAPRSA